MAKKVRSVQQLPNGKYRVTYVDLTTVDVDSSTLRTMGYSGNYNSATAGASGNTLEAGSYDSSTTDAAFQDPITGGPVAGAGTVPTKTGPKTVSELVLQARNPQNLSAIRKLLLEGGLITKGTKSLSSIQSAWLQVVIGAQSSQMDPEDYVRSLKAGGFGQDVEQNLPGAFPGIYSDTQAQAKITEVWQRELGRDPTPEELQVYTKEIKKAQAKNPSTQTYEIVNGQRVQKTVGGIDETQYLTNIVRKLPEYSEKKTQARDLTLQELTKTAAANGFDLNRDFGDSVNGWLTQIENGTDINIIKKTIRDTAALGVPENVKSLLNQGVDLESVYAPYKRVMASVLEINPESITLDDPLLRSAIGPDKEMSIYEFQRILRKDPRWQNTDNARETVSTAALGVLQDFGYQG